MLTDIACKSAVCPPGKARARLTDTGGLYLETSPTGFKRWFWKALIAQAKGTTEKVALAQKLATRRLACGVVPELDACFAALVFKP